MKTLLEKEKNADLSPFPTMFSEAFALALRFVKSWGCVV